jgi:hypothetical protein
MFPRRGTRKKTTSAADFFLLNIGIGIGERMEQVNPQFAEPQHEAAFFYGLFLRGHPLQKLREDIDVPSHVLERWQRLAERDPMYHSMLERMLTYRKHVLAIFDTLVFREMAVPHRTQ